MPTFKIQFGLKTLYLADDIQSVNLQTLNKKKAVIYRYSTLKKFIKIIEELPTYKVKNHIIYHHNPEELFHLLENQFKKIEASGGLVVNELDQILFIFRYGKWDLPKGKIEENETKDQAAIREIEEECNLKIDQIERHLITTYHTYELENKRILKGNHWYLMTAKSGQNLQPQIEEGIEKVEWKSKAEIPDLLKNSFSSISDVINTYLHL